MQSIDERGRNIGHEADFCVLRPLAGSTVGAFANGSEARTFSTLGQPPRVFNEAPPNGTMLRAFEVIYIDDHKCPGGRTKKYTAGNDRLGVRPTLAYVNRQTRLGQ